MLQGAPALTMAGLVGILDPPRPEAIEACSVARGAGVVFQPAYPTPYTLHPKPYTLHPTPYTLPNPYARQQIVVKMITGDHPGTATAVARMLGIVPPAAPPDTFPVPAPPFLAAEQSSVWILPGAVTAVARMLGIVPPAGHIPGDAEQGLKGGACTNSPPMPNCTHRARPSQTAHHNGWRFNGHKGWRGAQVVSGGELDKMSDADLDNIVLQCNVFARARSSISLSVASLLM